MLPRTMRERSQGLVLALAVIGAIALVAGAAVGLASPAGDAPRPSAPAVPHVNHVFIIVLENENADSTFGKHTAAPYLARQLRARAPSSPTTTRSGTRASTTTSPWSAVRRPTRRPRPIARSIRTSSPGRRPQTVSTAAPGACTRRRWPPSPTSCRARATPGRATWTASTGRRRRARTSAAVIPRSTPMTTPATRRGRRPVRGSPQPVRVLPFDHRLTHLRRARRRLRAPEP